MTLSRHHKQVIPPRIRNLACLISVSWLASVGCSHAGQFRFIKDCDLIRTLKIDGEVQRDASTFSEGGNPDFIMLLPSKGNAVLFSLSKEEQGVFAVPVEHIHRSDSTAWIDRRQILLVANAQWTGDFLRPGKSANVEFSLNESEYEASAMRLPRARWLTADCERPKRSPLGEN